VGAGVAGVVDVGLVDVGVVGAGVVVVGVVDVGVVGAGVVVVGVVVVGLVDVGVVGAGVGTLVTCMSAQVATPTVSTISRGVAPQYPTTPFLDESREVQETC